LTVTDMAEWPTACLYRGRVVHHRLRPFRQRFVYAVWTLFVPLDDLPVLDRRLRLLSVDRGNLISIRARDHGPRDGSALEPWVRRRLAQAGVADGGGRIFMLAFPRIFGTVFNPLTVYYAYDRADRLRAVLYEVKNTFGGQHTYAFAVDGAAARLSHGCAKDFYVSPFIPMEARYAFNLQPPGERLSVIIHESVPEGPQLVASMSGHRRALTDTELRRCLLAFGPMTLKVVLGIHWEALKLWLRGAPFRAPSAHPQQMVAGNTAERGQEP
jgi:DUF1365 family protein